MSDNDLKKIDVYLLTRQLGQGGMGIVYEARHSVIGRKCAIKVLHSALESNEILLTRMIREARAASNIGHPNIVEVYDFRKAPDGAYYMVMELLEGISLESLLDKRITLTVPEAVLLLSHILSALQAAHGKGIVHRDLKPDNVFISKTMGSEAVAKVLDFGISKFTRPENTQDELNLTKTGAVLGSPYYMSPEQASGKRDIDQRCDLWACGVILYEMLTGDVPFNGDNYNEVMANILMQDPPKPTSLDPDIPEGLEAVILKSLSKNREDRYESAAKMLEAIEPFLPDGSIDIEGLALRPAGILEGPDTTIGKTIHGFPDAGQVSMDPSMSGTRQRADSLNETQTAGQDISQSIHTLDIRHMSRTRLTLAALSLLLLLAAAGGAFTLMARSRKKRAQRKRAAAARKTSPRARSGTPTNAVSRKGGEKISRATQNSAPISPHKDANQASGHNRKSAATGSMSTPDAGPSASSGQGTSRDGGVSTNARLSAKQGSPRPSLANQKADSITVTLRNVPEHAVIYLDGKRVENPPFVVKKDHRQHCFEITKPGYKRSIRCFFPTRDRTFTVFLRRKKRPRNVYDSPY